jgi:hypothetical protein
MPDTITADRVLGHNIYAKGSVTGYSYDLKTPKKTWSNGQLIGKVDSWYVSPEGNMYWTVYLNNNDYNTGYSTYIPHDGSKLSLPDLPGILDDIQRKADEEKKERLGTVAYYIEKYAPWIVGGVVVAVAAPVLFNAGRKNVSGMTQDQKNMAGIAGTALVIFLLTKKKKPAGIEIEHFPGEFPDPNTGKLPGQMSTGSEMVEVISGPQLIEYVGPFPVTYKKGAGIISGCY